MVLSELFCKDWKSQSEQDVSVDGNRTNTKQAEHIYIIHVYMIYRESLNVEALGQSQTIDCCAHVCEDKLGIGGSNIGGSPSTFFFWRVCNPVQEVERFNFYCVLQLVAAPQMNTRHLKHKYDHFGSHHFVHLLAAIPAPTVGFVFVASFTQSESAIE
jgi:hypothetical protein